MFYKLSLASKILVATAALFVLLGVAGTVGFRLLARSRLDQEVALGTRMLASTAAEQASPLLAQGDAAALGKLVTRLQAVDRSISYALVRDRTGKVVAHTFSWDPPGSVLRPLPTHSPTRGDDYRKVQFEGRTYLDVVAPIRVDATGAE